MNSAALIALLPAINNGWAFAASSSYWECCISAVGTHRETLQMRVYCCCSQDQAVGRLMPPDRLFR